jgi:hypothetical protein
VGEGDKRARGGLTPLQKYYFFWCQNLMFFVGFVRENFFFVFQNAKPGGSSASGLSSAHRSRLVEIFAKVGNKEQTKEVNDAFKEPIQIHCGFYSN